MIRFKLSLRGASYATYRSNDFKLLPVRTFGTRQSRKSIYEIATHSFAVLAMTTFLFGLKAQAAVDLGIAKKDGGQAGAFLDFAATARSLGMGGAHVAVSDDAGAIYWNAAGLAQVERKDVVAMYSALYEDTSYGFFGYAQPTADMGTFGIGLVSLQSGEFQKRDNLGQKKGTFNQSDSAAFFSYGVRPFSRLSLGLTAKGVRQSIDTYADTSFGGDASMMYEFTPGMSFGFSARNIVAPKITLYKVADKFPMDLRAGFKFGGKRLLVALDASKTSKRSVKPHFGMEWKAVDMLTIRGGMDETQLTAGLGFKFGDFGLDYAFGYHAAASDMDNLGQSHRFGLHMNFGRKASEQEASLRWRKKGAEHLQAARSMMDETGTLNPERVEKMVSNIRQAVRHQAYSNPVDLYAAQGYIYFLENEFEHSVQALGEAFAMEPGNEQLGFHLEKARAHMTDERTQEIVTFETKRMRALYAKGDWKGTLKSSEKILSFVPGNAEARTFAEYSQVKINEPIERELKIARMKYEQKDFLDAIKSYNRVREIDPENAEAIQHIRQIIHELEKESDRVAMNKPVERQVYQLDRNPDKSREMYSRGIVLYSQDKLREAAQMWEQAVRLDKDNLLAQNAYRRVQAELSK